MKKCSGKICVFAASSQNIQQAYIDAAHQLGTLLAKRGWDVANGAGTSGLMRAVSDGAMDAGGHVIGVIPQFMVDNGWCYDRLTEVIITADMHERKQRLAAMTEAIIALPGGCGTLEELLETITWRQLGIISKPIIMLNTLGYYDPLVTMLHNSVEQGFMKAAHIHLWTVANSPEEAVRAIETELQQGEVAFESKY